MIVQIEEALSREESEELKDQIAELGFQVTEVATQAQTYFVLIGPSDFDIRRIGHLPGVRDVHRVSAPYKLVSKAWKVGGTSVEITPEVTVEPDELSIAAGPCSIEDEDQIRSVLSGLKESGIRMMRGGVFKPRTSPYSFRGVGVEGLKQWSELAREQGIALVSEVLSTDQIELMYPYVDVFQVGTRNAQNFHLLGALGEVDKPVLLKRGMSATLDELLHSAEYIFSSGNERLILCERGIRTFEKAYRNTLDLNAVPALRERTHLPIFVDPSHGVGVRRWVSSMAMAAVAAGADGLLLEAAPVPELAASDGAQTLSFEELNELVKSCRSLRGLLA